MKDKIDWEKHEHLVGEWVAPHLLVLIAGDGQVSVRRKGKFLTTTFNGPVRKITDQGLAIGYPFIGFSLRFSQAPTFEGGDWIIRLKDGTQLVKLKNAGGVESAELAGFRHLVQSVVSALARSLEEKDVSIFFKRASAEFNRTVSHEDFARTYSAFQEKGVGLQDCRADEILFADRPHLDSDSRLVLKGHYTQSCLLRFELKFDFDFPEWKVTALNLIANLRA